jgi:hypothetical protein
MTHIRPEHRSIGCAIDRHDRFHAVTRQQTQDADIASKVLRNRIVHPMAGHRPSISLCPLFASARENCHIGNVEPFTERFDNR